MKTRETETLTHRRHTDELPSGWVMLFAVDGDNDSYGRHAWALREELPHVAELDDLITTTIEWAEDTYGESWTRERAIDEINPQRIVGSAGLWDCPEYVGWVWETLAIRGVRTDDGAVVLDRETVEIEYLGEVAV